MWRAAKTGLLSVAIASIGTIPFGITQGALAEKGGIPITGTAAATKASSVYTWKLVKNRWYFMDQYGNKKTGWLIDHGKRYYLNQQGERQTGWIYDYAWYYLSPTDGSLVTNQWISDDKGEQYYLSSTGPRLENAWVKWDGASYYFGSNGVMRSSTWLNYNHSWYYLDPSGKMLTGWQQIGGKWDYFYSSGARAANTIVDGYQLGTDGVRGAIKTSVLLNVPLISQLPQLPKGCEVTSLAMLLNYAGVKVDKMTLAEQIKTVPYIDSEGYYGNPNDGFVGNMYTPLENTDSLGTNHGPIFNLATRYLGTRAVDLSGQSFNNVFKMLSEGRPVWVIHTFGYAPVPESDFFSVRTREGVIKINTFEHSLVITGYDNDYIYFNDPYANIKNGKADRAAFIAAWEQMGSQAISYH